MEQLLKKALPALIVGVAISGIAWASTITQMAGTDTISSSRTVINTNFTNLNADKIENTTTFTVSTSTNKIGVGTTTPAYTLDVYGSVRLGTSTASTLIFRGLPNFNNNFYINASGNVATGTWQGTAIVDAYVANDITLTNITQITNRNLSNLQGTLLVASTTGTLTYDRGGTGTSTVLATGYLFMGLDGAGKLIQVASSTLAGSGGVSSLNTLTGAQTLWGTNSYLTITASGTVGQIFNVGTSVATSGTPSLLSLTSVGTIAIGTWNGTPVSSTYGGTGTSTAGWTGIPKITSGTWATSSTVITRNPTFNFIPATTTTAYNTLKVRVPSVSTITEIGCQTDSGTSTLAFYEATEASPNASSSSILNSIVCTTGEATSTTFSDSSVAARNWIAGLVLGITNSTNTWAWVNYTITP